MFKIYNCDFGLKYNGVDYTFDHVQELQIEDPERNRVTRGANAKDKIGISYKEGMKDPKKWTIPIMNMSSDLKTVLDSVYESGDRVDAYCIDRKTGASKFLKNAVLCNRPQQLTLDDSAESMNVSLEFEGFDNQENPR